MVALGEAGDRIHPCLFQGLLPFRSIERGAYSLDVRRRMKVEMDLAKTERLGFHEIQILVMN